MTTVERVEEPSARYLAAAEPALVRGFELLATARGGISRLRELVLLLAAQGKLLPQNPMDEPANALLARIRTDKSSLAVGGRNKRAKGIFTTRAPDEPFEIPESWAWTRLGEITTFGECDKATAIADATWVLDLEDIEKGTGRIVRRTTFAERRSLSDKNVFRAGDVLYGKLRPYLNKVAVADTAGVCTTEIIPFRGYGGINPRYLRIVIQGPHFLAYVNARSYGMKMPRLGTDDGKNAAVPLPPLAEQHRIVARVEELMKLCDALEQSGRLADEQHARLTSTLFDALAASESAHALAENWQRVAEHFDLLLDRLEAIDSLEQTVLDLAVRGLLVFPDQDQESPPSTPFGGSDPEPTVPNDERDFTAPESWNWLRFGALWESSLYGPRFSSNDYVQEGGVPTVRTTDMSGGRVRLKQAPMVKVSAKQLETYRIQRGDLLVTHSGSIGVMALYDLEREAIPSAYLIRLRFKVTVVPAFGLLLLTSPTGQRLMGLSTTSVGVPNVNATKMAAFPVALPSVAEQHRIVARVEELRRLCADLRQRLTQARQTQSRLADALVAEVA